MDATDSFLRVSNGSSILVFMFLVFLGGGNVERFQLLTLNRFCGLPKALGKTLLALVLELGDELIVDADFVVSFPKGRLVEWAYVGDGDHWMNAVSGVNLLFMTVSD